MPTNTAAWINTKQARLTVAPAPYTHPDANEIVIHNHAVAINPYDWIIQRAGSTILPWIKYPFILGSDVAGEVVEIGSMVTRFKVGDRVLGLAVGTDKDSNAAARCAFQEYTVLFERLATPIPASMAYESAAVLPLGLSTAAGGLFQKDSLALAYPSVNPKPTGQMLLIWGGSTSVGSNAIQLAVAAGYQVITTASPHNFNYVKLLGAQHVFDYQSPTVVADIIAASTGKTLAGALAVGSGAAEPCVAIVHACKGNKLVALTSTAVSFENGMTPRVMLQMVGSVVALQVKCWRLGVRTKAIFGTSLKNNEVSTIIYQDFLPQALAEGRYTAAPEPSVIGQGLASIQAGFEVQIKGVSAKKVVVSL